MQIHKYIKDIAIEIRYSTEPRKRKYITGSEFLSFPEYSGNEYA